MDHCAARRSDGKCFEDNKTLLGCWCRIWICHVGTSLRLNTGAVDLQMIIGLPNQIE
jgi:hypothetical protein